MPLFSGLFSRISEGISNIARRNVGREIDDVGREINDISSGVIRNEPGGNSFFDYIDTGLSSNNDAYRMSADLAARPTPSSSKLSDYTNNQGEETLYSHIPTPTPIETNNAAFEYLDTNYQYSRPRLSDDAGSLAESMYGNSDYVYEGINTTSDNSAFGYLDSQINSGITTDRAFTPTPSPQATYSPPRTQSDNVMFDYLDANLTAEYTRTEVNNVFNSDPMKTVRSIAEQNPDMSVDDLQKVLEQNDTTRGMSGVYDINGKRELRITGRGSDDVEYSFGITDDDLANPSNISARSSLRWSSSNGEFSDNDIAGIFGREQQATTSTYTAGRQTGATGDATEDAVQDAVNTASEGTGASTAAERANRRRPYKSTYYDSFGQRRTLSQSQRLERADARKRMEQLQRQVRNAEPGSEQQEAFKKQLEEATKVYQNYRRNPRDINPSIANYIAGNPRTTKGVLTGVVTGGLVLELARSNGSLSNAQLYGQAPLQNDYY